MAFEDVPAADFSLALRPGWSGPHPARAIARGREKERCQRVAVVRGSYTSDLPGERQLEQSRVRQALRPLTSAVWPSSWTDSLNGFVLDMLIAAVSAPDDAVLHSQPRRHGLCWEDTCGKCQLSSWVACLCASCCSQSSGADANDAPRGRVAAKTSAFAQLSLSSRGPACLQPRHALDGEARGWHFASRWREESESGKERRPDLSSRYP